MGMHILHLLPLLASVHGRESVPQCMNGQCDSEDVVGTALFRAKSRVSARQEFAADRYGPGGDGAGGDSGWSGSDGREPSAYRGGSSLRNNDFVGGTVIIDRPGRYVLTEDIVFDPITPLNSGVSGADVHFPDPLSQKYPQGGGYFLGFFAAISIVADNVVLDCQNHKMEMSRNFLKRQRFYSHIELGSKPFFSNSGPPQFKNPLLQVGAPTFPDNTVIQNCNLGLSSHHGIHGNENSGVVVKNVRIYDFEVGGIHLNGPSDVHIENVDIGPSLKETFNARLSHGIFLDHLMNTLLMSQPDMAAERNVATVTIRGKTETVAAVLNKFHGELEKFYATGHGKLKGDFGNGLALPDGSAIYGIVIHKTGPAINDFGSCPFLQVKADGGMVDNVTIKDVNIHDLAVDVNQATRMVHGGKPVMGPAGDIFDWRLSVDAKDRYRGSLLSDAQLAVGSLKKHLLKSGFKSPELAWYFGGTNIPDDLLDWAASGKAWQGDFGKLTCNTDSMSHANKGAIGLFLSYLSSGSLSNVNISRISNAGGIDAWARRCISDEYHGRDVRGVAMVNSIGVTNSGINVDASSLIAGDGGLALPYDEMRT